MTDQSSSQPEVPYVGPTPITAGQPFHGRQKETDELIIRLKANHTLLLHSPSGAGKTSLIQAGLIPGLGQDYLVLPITRVSLQPQPGIIPADRTYNRYLLSALLKLDQALPPKLQSKTPDMAGSSLVDFLETYRPRYAEFTQKQDTKRTLLVIDQFEEFLTIDPADKAAKQAFLGELLPVLYDNRYWVLFALREDYLARLEFYLSYFPDRLSARFRLEFLEPPMARQAIQEPARQFKVVFQDEAADRLVKDLRQVYVRNAQGEVSQEDGPFIEPVQLQVVCKTLWEAQRPDPAQISLQDVEQFGDVDNALASYFEGEVKKASEAAQMPERNLREWIGNRLITSQGLRNQVLSGPDPEYGVTEAAISSLVDAYLVREDQRRGTTWLELAHDRLVEPILKNNAAWFEKNLSLLQRQASLWGQAGRPDHLLLSDNALKEAKTWAASGVKLTQLEKELLKESLAKEVEKQNAVDLQIKTRIAARQRRLLILVTALAILAIIFAGFSFVSLDVAQTQRGTAQARLDIITRVGLEGLVATETKQAEIALAPQSTRFAAGTQTGVAATLKAAGANQTAAATELANANATQTAAANQSTVVAALRQTSDAATASAAQQGEIAQVATQVALGGPPSGLSVEQLINAAERLTDSQPDLALLLGAIAYHASNRADAPGESLQNLVDDLGKSWRSLGVTLAQMGSPALAAYFSPDRSDLAISAQSGDVTLLAVDLAQLAEKSSLQGTSRGIPDWMPMPSENFRVERPPDPDLLGMLDVQNFFFGPEGQALALVGPKAQGVSVYWSEEDSINWEEVSKKDYTFAALRISPTIYERTTIDGNPNRFRENWLTMIGQDYQDVMRGAYWVFDPSQNPVDQADQFYDLVTSPRTNQPYGEIGDLPLILQVLQTGGLGRDDLASAIQAALIQIENRSGRRPILYTSPQFWDKYLVDQQGEAPDWTADYPLWVQDTQSRAQPRLPKGWSTWTFWDYASSDRTERVLNTVGEKTTFYFSLFNGTLAQLEDFAGKPRTDLALTNKFVYLWDVGRGEPLRKLGVNPEYITSVTGSGDGSILLTGRSGGSTDAWDLASLTRSGGPDDPAAGHLLTVGDQGTPVWTLVLSPETKLTVSTNDLGQAWLWDTYSQSYKGIELDCRSGTILAPAFNNDANYLAAGSGNWTCLWDLSQIYQNLEPQALEGHNQPVTAVIFNPDGVSLASGDSAGQILIWDLRDLNLPPLQLNAPSGVTELAFDPTGMALAAGGEDGTVWLWKDWTTQPQARTLYGHKARVNSLAFNPDEGWLISAGDDGQVIAWDLSLDTPDKQACKLAGRNPTEDELKAFGLNQSEIERYINICTIPED